jgi:hypothetical protein
MKKKARRLGLGLASVFAAYVALLTFPDPLFAHARAGRFVTVHADEPIPASADAIVADTEARLARSPLLLPGVAHHLYVCQSAWRWRLLSNGAFHSGAYAFGPFARPVFTRPVHFDRDRLVGPSGNEATGERTVAYFFAHEVTHTLTSDFLGPAAYMSLPAWAREGYADYVARGDTFDYAANRALFVAGDRTLDPSASGLYLRYALLVAHLVDREGWSPEQLLQAPPDREALERRIREDRVEPR